MHIGSLKIFLLWLKCILKLLYCSLRMKIKCNGRGNEKEVSEGEGRRLVKQIITALFIGFNEGWRPICLKSQQGQHGSSMEMAPVHAHH